MFSVNNFYDYLRHKYSWPKENSNNFIFKFNTNGSRNLGDMSPYLDKELYLKEIGIKDLHKYYGKICAFDQEPLIFDYYNIDSNCLQLSRYTEKQFGKEAGIYMFLASVWPSIICHSEQNSKEIEALVEHGFLEVHYWWHGLVARDWFRHWKHYEYPNSITNGQRFGMYVRDISGPRKYRETLLGHLTELSLYTNWPNSVSSDSSAIIDWDDCNKFQIQIVAETLFETEKVHLTEKVFKPIVMDQPFILAGPPFSLEYLKEYGFRTFDGIWSEKYDKITDHEERLHEILKIIKWMNSLSKEDFNYLIWKAKRITQHNRELFYSDVFEDRLLGELHINMDQALSVQEDKFQAEPGGMFFRDANELYLKTGYLTDKLKSITNQSVKQMLKDYPDIGKQVIKKYNHLL